MTENAYDFEETAQLVAARALEIVLKQLDRADLPVAEDDDLQHVGYSQSIMGYDK